MTVKTKRTVRKPSAGARYINFTLCLVGAAISVILIAGVVKEVTNNRRLRVELSEAQGKLEALNQTNTALSEEKSNLQDPSYVQNYARGTHLLSKSGETVFILPKS